MKTGEGSSLAAKGRRIPKRAAKTLAPFLHEKMFVAGLIMVGTMVIIAMFAPWISPYTAQGEAQTPMTTCPQSAAGN